MSIMTALIAFLPALASAKTAKPSPFDEESLRLAAQIIDLKIANEQQEREIGNLRQQNASLRGIRDALMRALTDRAREAQQAQTLDMVNPEWMRVWPGAVVEVPPDQMARLLQDAHRQVTGFCDCTPRGGRAGALRGSVGPGT